MIYSNRYKRSPLFLVLKTPSKSFRHCSLPRVMWGVLWEVKSMSGILRLHMEKSCFLISGQTDKSRWKCIYLFQKNPKGCLTRDFRGKLIYEKTWSWKSRVRLPLKGCKFWQRPCNTILCTGGIFNCPHGCVYRVHYIYIVFWGRGTGFSDFVT